MPAPITNDGTTYYNVNQCKSFALSLSTNLSAFPDQVCSEVIVYNTTGQGILIFDQNNSSNTNAFALSAGEQFTFRGITNSNQVSAKTTAGTGTASLRTQFFSIAIQRP